MSTPSQGAHSPRSASELENARSAGTPAALTPATIPNAIRPSWVAAQTSRLEPEIIWPSVSSRNAVVSATPGMNTTRAAIIARRPGSVTSCLTASAGQQGNGEGGDEGHQHLERAPPACEQPQHADDGAEHGGGRDVARRRTQDQRDPDRQRRVAEHARHGPKRLRVARISSSRAIPSAGTIAPRSASSARRWTAAIWSRRGVAESRFVGSIVAASPRPSVRKQRGREDAEACVLEPVGAGDQRRGAARPHRRSHRSR